MINPGRHISLTIILAAIIIQPLKGQDAQLPGHIAYDLKAERIKFSSNSIKLTWKMNSSFNGEFVVGRSEKELNTPEDALKSELLGVFYSGQEGFLIDRDLKHGKNYFYIVISKEHLLKREIEILKNINSTSAPLYIFSEPETVQGISAGMKKDNSILVEWDTPGGSGLKFNLYRSRSVINTSAELEVAEKLITTDDDEYTDKNVPEYGSYFYAVTVTDKNGIEYFNPRPEKNFTSNGIYIKGKTLATPLNVGAYLSTKDSIIVKWEKATSRTGRELSGYEVYRSDEMINSLLKLKFARLLQIVDTGTILYTDAEPEPGKYYYAVFARYSDGTVDINFDDESNYTKTPVIITLPYRITALTSEVSEDRITLRWNFSGNSGTETVVIFRHKIIPENSTRIMNDDIIGTENIKSGKFIIPYPEPGSFYYGVIIRDNNTVTDLKPGINITNGAIVVKKNKRTGKSEIIKKEKIFKGGKIPGEKGLIPDTAIDSDLDIILKNLFYKEQFHAASKALKKYIDGTDNEYNRAKARLFLARSYIELREYRAGISILDSSDVRINFPEEAKFWSEFATVRLK